jgi:hypothetical protein
VALRATVLAARLGHRPAFGRGEQIDAFGATLDRAGRAQIAGSALAHIAAGAGVLCAPEAGVIRRIRVKHLLGEWII